MQDISQEQADKRFQALPDALKDAIFSEKTSDAILKSCALRDIPPTKTYVTGRLTGRVLLGYLRPELFAQEVQKETGVDMEKARLVAHDIDTEVFANVRLELKKLYPPTIQTPTMQSPGFAPSPAPLPAKPRYVIPIPEKFLKKEWGAVALPATPPAMPQPAPIQPPPQHTPQPTVITSSESSGGQAIPQQPVPAQPLIKQPAAPPLKANEADAAKEAPLFKPVVPLPTFIQSKFKRELGIGDQRSETQKAEQQKPPQVKPDEPSLARFVQKFVPAHEEVKKESLYREKVDPSPEKKDANVDLSKF
ncbi:MAG: hypothetical protein AAB581_04320 [Patescibacteria group bacterium]